MNAVDPIFQFHLCVVFSFDEVVFFIIFFPSSAGSIKIARVESRGNENKQKSIILADEIFNSHSTFKINSIEVGGVKRSIFN